MARRFLTSDTAPPPAPDGTPPASHTQWNLHGSAAKVAIAGNVIVAALFFAAIVWRIFFSGRGLDDEDDAFAPQARGAGFGAAVPASSSSASTPGASPRAGGLRKDDLLALPVYVHGSCPEEGGAGGEGRVECAVCIRELRDGDTGRILPRCGHRFHAECVDRWFRSHVTCPLCRAVVADGGSAKSYPKMNPMGMNSHGQLFGPGKKL
ncbi:hypothetical protein C2845_PM01G14440 [Panicum miliaceum]|uniref:RING-type E3 ubiquitin transferase n=1 Tax=Panicum miliaceum TaxID=4540 RepID=A0A3L6TLC2_PANMI|nr:hypothetical protein C2845_PM01G14440 [Panicum miliaceum]